MAPLRLPTGRMAVLLGPPDARADVLARLDTAQGADGRRAAVQRVRARRDASLADRLAVVEDARRDGPAVLLVDRLTDGLSAADRRALLSALAPVAAAGTAVLVDDAEPVAALAYADLAFRVDASGELTIDDLGIAA